VSLWEQDFMHQTKPTQKDQNKLGLSWAKLSQNWGLKLGFDVEV